jgi:hypothetical protein
MKHRALAPLLAAAFLVCPPLPERSDAGADPVSILASEILAE